MNTKQIKVIFADIDGTLIGKDHIMLPKTREMLNQLHHDGILLGLASGRQVGESMFAYAKEWGLDFQFDYFIGMNGGQLYFNESGKMIEYYKLSRESIQKIVEMMEPLDLNPFRYQGEAMLCKRMDQGMIDSIERNGIPGIVAKDLSELWAEENAKILFRVDEGMDEVFAYAKAHPDPSWQCFLTQPTMLEFQDPRVNKGYALEQFAKEMNLPISSIMAFGDMDNDNQMLKSAGYGVCLANGGENTKACADEITEYDVENDGFGKYIAKYFYAEKQ